MPLKVIYFATYKTRGDSSPTDLDARDFVLALKNRDFNGYANISILGKTHRITRDNKDVAIECFADLVVDYLSKKRLRPPLVLVPVPSASATCRAKGDWRILQITDSIAHKVGSGSKMKDILRWKVQREPTHTQPGTPRDPRPYYENLVVTVPFSTKYPVILIDDVMTSGAHFQASAARLKEAGINPKLAICLGRTVHESQGSVFATYEELIDDFAP